MTQILLLFGLVAVTSSQIIFPDQYEMMKNSTTRPYAYTNAVRASGSFPGYSTQTASNSQPAQGTPEFADTARPIAQTPSVAQAAPVGSPNSLQSEQTNWNQHVNDLIAKGIVKFSLDMDKAIYNTRGVNSRRENVLFSPLSISVALSLVLLGSAGKTFEEVSRVLGLEVSVDISQHSEIVHQMFGQLLATMNHRIEGSNMPRVNSASGIFVQEGYPIRPEFGAISENVYKSEVVNLDFQKKGREAQNIINNWVKQRTMGKIESILDQAPTPLTSVILLSALYFKGEWNQHFINGQTQRRDFFVEPNDAVKVDMMFNGGDFPFYEDKTVKILALPYKGLEMSMYVLLPKTEGATALKNFRDQLSAEIIENLISNLKNQTCIVGLPRMKLSSTLNLNQALQSLGLISLFDPKTADLSLLSSGYGQAPVTRTTSFTTSQPVPIASPSPIPQTIPQALPLVSSQQVPSSKSEQFLIFPRIGEDNHGVRKNYFIRTRRDVVSRRENDSKSSQTLYVTENEDPKKNTLKINNGNTKYVSLDENKYRFHNAKKNTKNRSRRQSRPIDESFLRFVRSQNFVSYDLDKLRNSGNLVNPGLFAHEVLHKVEMDVTEKGTEAAATTGVILQRDGSQKKLIANRPFLFFIRHKQTKLILFWGTVNAPTPNYTVR
ncbi:leukocyte elastase inhibitor isoform X2 [Pseudomyrmex gracilis]|uniref:leukocyte elastase inhibitor isoform X2 n=1 Tax=Pseudomyrmex gracilis TaxID=219809 RepID=UPI0009952EB2|nr:leukocyte elastase inhibitor isoform X2 [Pseudomyrmex gracilis]